MRVSDIKNRLEPCGDGELLATVDVAMPLVNIISEISNAEDGKLDVTEDGKRIGRLTATALLSGLAEITAPAEDSSVVELYCPAANFSASQIAHATEDVNVSISDMLTTPNSEGDMHITLRLRTSNPTAAIRNLERYGYEVADCYSPVNTSMTTALERLAALQAILNV